MSKEVAEVLRKALAAFGPNGERWVQGTRNAFEEPNCCVLTSFERTGMQPWIDAYESGTTALRRVAGVNSNIDLVSWNDNKLRKFKHVKALFEKAIAHEENDSTTAKPLAPAAKEKH